MAAVKCSRCGREVGGDDINVGADVAFCRACNVAHRLSDIAAERLPNASVDLDSPPAGCWFHDDGVETVIGASCRSLGSVMGVLAISLFWNGIVSVFVLLALGSTLKHVGVDVPQWFPAPSGKGGGADMSLGMTIFLWIFLLPFILVGAVLIGAFLMTLAGKVVVRVRESHGVVFTGIGPLGRTRRFDALGVKSVRLEDREWRDSDGNRHHRRNITLEADTTLKFGSMLPTARRQFMAGALSRTMVA